jgi:uncharacterized protein (DUF1778 family)
MPTRKKNVQRRPAIVKVTLSVEEKAVLAKAATRAGIPLSIYVRAAALKAAQDEAKP